MKEIKKVIGAIDAVREAARKAVEDMANANGPAKGMFQAMRLREELEASFKKVAFKPSDLDIAVFSTLKTHEMELVIRFLKEGVKLDDIKSVEFWRDYELKCVDPEEYYRIASFKKAAGTYTDQDIEEFRRIPVNKRRDILRFLACGYKLEKIKTYTIWKQHQTKQLCSTYSNKTKTNRLPGSRLTDCNNY